MTAGLAEAITAIRSSRMGAMLAGLILASGAALGTNVAFLLKQRGAMAAPAVRLRHPVSSAAGLFPIRTGRAPES